LILGTTVTNGLSSPEAVDASSLGYGVNIVDASTWDSMTTAQFASYRAIILGDPTCSSESSVAAAESNAATWSAAVNGNVIVVGTDPVYHQTYGDNETGAATVTQDGVAYATDGPSGTTGAYIDLSCYYESSSPDTNVAVLDDIAGGGWEAGGNLACTDSGHAEANIVADIPTLSRLNDSDLLSWECSVHEVLDTYPASFIPVAIDPGAPIRPTRGRTGSAASRTSWSTIRLTCWSPRWDRRSAAVASVGAARPRRAVATTLLPCKPRWAGR
jgi:hypothetical protein